VLGSYLAGIVGSMRMKIIRALWTVARTIRNTSIVVSTGRQSCRQRSLLNIRFTLLARHDVQ
jgi:hypothetical protein